MTEKRIKWICGMEPMREGEYPSIFEVGKNGVTEITAETENYGDHGIAWFNVHFGEHVLQRMQFRAVAGIRYFAPSEA